MKCSMCRFEVDPETGMCPLGHQTKSLIADQSHKLEPAPARERRRTPRAKAIVIGTAIGLAILMVLALPGLISRKSPVGVSLSLSQPSAPSSAAIAARQRLINACESTIQTMKAARMPTSKASPVLTIQGAKLAPLPTPLNYPTKVVGHATYRTPDQYINASAIPDVDGWRLLMKRDGFKVGASVEFASGQDHWNAVALEFASPAKAADFQRTSIGGYCSFGLLQGLKQLPTMPGSFTFTRLDPTSPYRAFVLVGSSVIHLNICHCVETSNPIGLATRWADAVGVEFGLRRPTSSAQA